MMKIMIFVSRPAPAPRKPVKAFGLFELGR
jgi:hypothetical protein